MLLQEQYHKQFSDRSQNATVWSWNFGDGANSTMQNPMHTYSAGNYTVTLTISNVNGTDAQSQAMLLFQKVEVPS